MGVSQKLENNRSIVLTVIHTFGAVIEQFSLTIEIMVKCCCSHAGPSNKSVKVLLGIWEMGTYSHLGIELHVFIHNACT